MIIDLYTPEEILRKIAISDAELVRIIIEKESKNENCSYEARLRKSYEKIIQQVELEKLIKNVMES